MRSVWSRTVARGIIALGALMSPPPMKPWHSKYPKGKVHREYEPWGLVRTIAHNSLASYLGVGNALMSIDLEHRLREVEVPTLLVVGEKDSIYPVHMSETMHRHIPDSRLKIVPDANHVLILNEPEKTAQHLIAFLMDSLTQ
jgi:pimeloyl-ACP methyl ester carboxylesterase